MGFLTKVQLIRRKASSQWYVNFPSAIAQALQFVKGEIVEWIIEDKATLVLRRTDPPPSALKKGLPISSTPSTPSGSNAKARSPKTDRG